MPIRFRLVFNYIMFAITFSVMTFVVVLLSSVLGDIVAAAWQLDGLRKMLVSAAIGAIGVFLFVLLPAVLEILKG